MACLMLLVFLRQAARACMQEEQTFDDDSETGLNMDIDVAANLTQDPSLAPSRSNLYKLAELHPRCLYVCMQHMSSITNSCRSPCI